MQRLAVHLECPDQLARAQAVRRAIAAAREARSDALWAEANPDLPYVLQLLALLGFARYATDSSGPLRRTFLQLQFTPPRWAT